jgi:hypothetical protein
MITFVDAEYKDGAYVWYYERAASYHTLSYAYTEMLHITHEDLLLLSIL